MSAGHRPRVLLADDHLLVAEALKSLLEPEFDLVGVVEDGRELVQAAAGLRPDAIVADITRETGVKGSLNRREEQRTSWYSLDGPRKISTRLQDRFVQL